MPADYLSKIRKYNIRRARPKPGKCALLVIDMQEYFRGVAEPMLPELLGLISSFREGGVPVMFTRHGHRDQRTDGGMLRRWWGDLIRYGSPEWELLPELRRARGEPVIDKNRYSAFFGTRLDERLRRAGVEDLVVCGVLTNCCCETTARDAFVRDYRVFFAADATAATDEELHLAALKNLAFGFAHVVRARDLS